jgi:hypothetical protein
MKADLCFGFSKSKWEELSQSLDSADENAWAEGIGVFERRIRERFLRSIEALFAADTKPDLSPSDSANTRHCIPGFAIIALCCLLIETLQGFREAPFAAANPAGPCSFPPGPCIKPPPGTNQQFIKFLRRPAFGGAFNDEVAKRFASGMRNGILHEAETRKWVIWREEPVGEIAAQEEDGYALNRSLFYDAVKKEFETYLRELRDPANKELRQRFKKKMDDLCGEA